MGSELAWATSQSARVAGDVQNLDTRVRGGRVREARQSSIRLRLDSVAFASGAGRFGNELRRLSRMKCPAAVAAYFKDQTQGLSADWYEGNTLVRLANLMWADPLGLVPAT